jgi:hypothetical protein
MYMYENVIMKSIKMHQKLKKKKINYIIYITANHHIGVIHGIWKQTPLLELML